MIEVRIKRNEASDIIGFRVSGHAFFADAGKDIICAAVSMLTINTINAIESFCDDKADVTVDKEKGFIEAILSGDPGEGSKLLLKTFHLGVTSIENKYGSSYVKVLEES
ncbi:MAG: ribosomal-processing cysteine protease Prp [Lachnospiraceae bacterium]|nr:ribosomal-processing cysteine protease Prp [Lachnospiraceae bacterium]